MIRRPVIALLLAVAIGVSVATPSVRADVGKTLKHPPSLLWKSYPLQQRAKAQARAKAKAKAARLASRTREASAQTGSSDASGPSALLVVTMVLAAMVAAGTIVLSRLRPVHIGLPFSRRRRVPPPPTTTVRRKSGEELLEALRPWLPPGSDEPPEAVAVAPARPALPEPSPEPSPVAESTETRPKPEPRRPKSRKRVKPRKRLKPKPQPQPKRSKEPRPSQEAKPAPRPEAAPKQEPTPRPETRPTREVVRRPSHREGTSLAWCEIKLWRGFVKCQLYAVLEGSEDRAIASSKYFRLHDDGTSSPQGQEALTALLERLEAEGWTVVLVGPTWYGHRLERFE
jgi:hypothetical protein